MNNPLPSLHLPDLSHLPDLPRASASWLATLGVGLAIGLPVAAAADSLDSETSPRPVWTRWLDPNADKPPIGENVFYKKGTGLEYRQEMKVGQNPIEVGIQGPLLKKKKDPSMFAGPSGQPRRMSGVGMTLEVRF